MQDTVAKKSVHRCAHIQTARLTALDGAAVGERDGEVVG